MTDRQLLILAASIIKASNQTLSAAESMFQASQIRDAINAAYQESTL